MPTPDFESFTPEEDASARRGHTDAPGWAPPSLMPMSDANKTPDPAAEASKMGGDVLGHRDEFNASMDPKARDAQMYALHALQSQAFEPMSEVQQGRADAAQRNAYATMGPQIQASMSGAQAARGLMSALSMQGAAQGAGMGRGLGITDEAMAQNQAAMGAFGEQAGAMRGQANNVAQFNAQQQGNATQNVYRMMYEAAKAQRDRQNRAEASRGQAEGEALQGVAGIAKDVIPLF